jgi:hypothetical protein
MDDPNNTTDTLDQTDEEVLTHTASDEAAVPRSALPAGSRARRSRSASSTAAYPHPHSFRYAAAAPPKSVMNSRRFI